MQWLDDSFSYPQMLLDLLICSRSLFIAAGTNEKTVEDLLLVPWVEWHYGAKTKWRVLAAEIVK